jgi:isopenicillin N synthase-like dioxygenase
MTADGKLMASPANSSLAENEIPILDLGPYFAGEVGALEVLGRELYRASTEVGFYFLKNHGVSQSLIDQAFVESKRFHDQSLEEKRKLKVDKNKIGYFEVESSITRHSDLAAGAKPNLYAAYCLRRELAPDDPDILAGVPYRAVNRWPDKLPGFRENLLAYSIAVEALGKKLLPIFATALSLPVSFFDAKFDKPLVNMQLNYYPHQRNFDGNQYGLAPHTDRGFITILCQAKIPGLEIRTIDGRWVIAPVLPGHFLVNTGDLLRHWTNDVFLSTPHRVINLSGDERHSIPFFYKPDLPTVIECIPTCQSAERPAKYPKTTVLDFYDWFVKQNYPDVKEAQSKARATALAVNE